MLKRMIDIILSLVGLIIFSPVLFTALFLVWFNDKHSPFYIAQRVGKDGHLFQMIKIRSMVIHAEKTGVDSTSAKDARITAVGHFIRKYKLDELSQLWNVLKGDMSLVGPRPNVKRETDLYTSIEKRLLSVKPGITDFSSIIFSDEGKILENYSDPDIAYHQLIRPGKSLLGLFYVGCHSNLIDLKLCWLTMIAIISRKSALLKIQKLLKDLDAPDDLIILAGRECELIPMPPPGSDEVVMSRG